MICTLYFTLFLDDDNCKNFENQCEYSCIEIQGVTQCVCPSGYTLTDNGINCTGQKHISRHLKTERNV